MSSPPRGSRARAASREILKTIARTLYHHDGVRDDDVRDENVIVQIDAPDNR